MSYSRETMLTNVDIQKFHLITVLINYHIGNNFNPKQLKKNLHNYILLLYLL